MDFLEWGKNTAGGVFDRHSRQHWAQIPEIVYLRFRPEKLAGCGTRSELWIMVPNVGRALLKAVLSTYSFNQVHENK